jgi:hypothetical protein
LLEPVIEATSLAAMPLRKNGWLWYCIVAVPLAAIGIALWYFTTGRLFNERYNPPPMSFDGTSDRLQQTVIVPTLDSPIPGCVSKSMSFTVRLKRS